jgi:putative transposase
MDTSKMLVTIISYCLMPNHFHLCVRQETDGGVRVFLQRLLNSFSHYFHIKYKEHGPLFESTFRSKLIETDEQLMHLSRYHHLNPVTAGIVEHPRDYVYSSYNDYMKEKSVSVNPSFILSHFSSRQKYERYVLDRREYQRKLDEIKHLMFK